MTSPLQEFLYDVTAYADVTDEGDIAWAVNIVLDLAIDALRRDPRIEYRTLLAWDLFFANARRAAEERLTDTLCGLADYDELICRIAEAVGPHLRPAKTNPQKAQQTQSKELSPCQESRKSSKAHTYGPTT